MTEFAPLLPLQGSNTPQTIHARPADDFPEDTSPKGLTRKRLKQELACDLAYTGGQVRHMPPASSGSSRNPNHTLTFNFVNDHFLNREAHEEAVAIVEGWHPQPWKGQIWKGVGKSNIERVWTGPVHYDLIWNGYEWLRSDASHSASVDPGAIDFNFPTPGMSELTAGYERIAGWGAKRVKAILIPTGTGESTAPVKKPETLYGPAKLKAEKELNAAYVLFMKDPIKQEDFANKLSAYVLGTRSNAIYQELSERAEMHIDGGDILGEFLLRIMRWIKNGKYAHEGKIQNWLGYQWGNYYLPEMQADIRNYLDRTTYVNQTDVGGGNDDEDYEHQEHSEPIWRIQKEQVAREREGYYAPVSRDRIFRRMNAPTQAIVRMLCEGLSLREVAVNLNISDRQLLRRRDVAKEDGEAALSTILSTLQACADEDQDSNVICIDASADYGGYVGDISACAAEESAFEPLLSVPEAAKLLCIHPKTLQALARSGEVPCLRMGKYWRFRASSLDAWVENQLISDHQSRRVS
jgi:excisionase family DNA binding protein